MTKAVTNEAILKQEDLTKAVKEANFLESKKRYKEACKIWQEVLELHEAQPVPDLARQAYIRLGSIYLIEGNLSEAKNIVKKGLKFLSSSKFLLILHAKIAQKEQNYVEAISRWTKVREKYPDHEGSYVQTGHCLLALDKPDEAEDLFKQGIKRFPDAPEPLAGLAHIFQKQKQWSESLKHWQLVHAHFPEFMPSHINIGNIFWELGKFEEAESVLKVASEKWPSASQITQKLALTQKHIQLMRESSSKARVFVIGAYKEHGGAYMAYHLGRILHENYDMECYVINTSNESANNDMFTYPYHFDALPLQSLKHIINNKDFLIANPSFSNNMFGLNLPGTKIMYIQHFNTLHSHRWFL